MNWTKFRNRTLSFCAGGLVGVFFVFPTAARADIFDIFSGLNSVIGSTIGTTLTTMTTIASTLQSDMQTVLFPVQLISQSQNFVTGIIGSYRSWMSTVFTMQSGSAQLSGNQLLELETLSGLQGPIANISGTVNSINAKFASVMGSLPTSLAASQAHRQMMDMSDAVSKNGLAQSVVGDQSASAFLTMASGIETQSASAAPGTAVMLGASAKAAELSSLAGQHQLLAAMLREEAGVLAHDTAVLKQSVSQTQQLGDNLKASSSNR